MCAEVNELLKEAVIKRGRIFEFYAECSNVTHTCSAPWLFFNIYCQQVSLLLDSDEVFTTCLSQLGKIIPQILESGEQLKESERQNAINYSLRYLEKILQASEHLKHNSKVNIDAIIHYIGSSLKPLFDASIFNEKDEIDGLSTSLIAMKVLASLLSGTQE